MDLLPARRRQRGFIINPFAFGGGGGGGSPETFFGSGAPSISAQVAFPSELGMRFQAGAAGNITKIRFWACNNLGAGTIVGNIWSDAGSLLASATFGTITLSAWNEVTLSSALAISSATVYVVSVNCPDNFDYTNGFGPPLNNGLNLSLPATGFNGVYHGTAGTFPNNSGAGQNYWRDIEFVP